MKVVLDTNVLISGLMLPDSTPGKIVRAWRNAQFDLVLSIPLLDEIAKVLGYPKIQKRLKWDTPKIDQFILLLRFNADVVPLLEETDPLVPTDPDDNMVLATFLAGQADYVISGDSDLLDLSDRYPVVTPAEFARQL